MKSKNSSVSTAASVLSPAEHRVKERLTRDNAAFVQDVLYGRTFFYRVNGAAVFPCLHNELSWSELRYSLTVGELIANDCHSFVIRGQQNLLRRLHDHLAARDSHDYSANDDCVRYDGTKPATVELGQLACLCSVAHLTTVLQLIKLVLHFKAHVGTVQQERCLCRIKRNRE